MHALTRASTHTGAIAPLIPPHRVRDLFYVDGGIFHNTPILKALSEGATRVIAMLLSPIGTAMTVNYSAPSSNRGLAIIDYYIDVLDRRIFSGEQNRNERECTSAQYANTLTRNNANKHAFVISIGTPLGLWWRRSAVARRYGSQDCMLPVPRVMARSQPMACHVGFTVAVHFNMDVFTGLLHLLQSVPVHCAIRPIYYAWQPDSSRGGIACLHPAWRCRFIDR
jgi:predicted acylesterase/phospholipase RssA